ncbi:rho-associated protein kinase 1 isoform X1 [Patella vulgata]|uniref:rho-associated protein kinase 1 isoform X1 n=1 Tax=Patella vulgata TaxID=6465 RepID=UPI00217FC597|nr:rho-associated protein kinase 1 isoform X1 [Patella vulgata]XP_050415786.1 rho-associated protein kinase 1 isoform X1 [Patella vulgata]
MAAKRQTSVPDLETYKANDGVQKIRIKELEDEVSSLKKRLDDLRKAKNTTILKREREVLEVGTPFAKRDSKDDLKVANLEKKLQATDQKRDKEMDDLRKKFASEMEALKRSNQKEENCNHEAEFSMLKTRIEELEADNAALRIHGNELFEKVKSLQNDLSMKEAHWCKNEEKLKIQLKISIGEKYKDWMNTTEAKIKELQETNETLRGYLKNKK